MKVIDLRSDTVTLPTKEMMDAIVSAELGDDVSREDPTVNKLEEMAAERFGKESALLVPSGTAGNLISVLTHCRHGDEVYCEAEAHIYFYEVGGLCSIAGAVPRLIKGTRGVFTGEQLETSFRGRELHFPNPPWYASRTRTIVREVAAGPLGRWRRSPRPRGTAA
jgi:threonine aldolase